MYYFFMCSQQHILPLYPHFHIIPICSLHSNSLRPLSEIWHEKWRFHRRRNHIVLQGSGSPTTINDSCIIDLTPWTWPCNADLANHAHSKILWVITAKQNNVQLGALTAVQYNRKIYHRMWDGLIPFYGIERWQIYFEDRPFLFQTKQRVPVSTNETNNAVIIILPGYAVFTLFYALTFTLSSLVNSDVHPCKTIMSCTYGIFFEHGAVINLYGLEQVNCINSRFDSKPEKG